MRAPLTGERQHRSSSFPKFAPHITLASLPWISAPPLSIIRAAISTNPIAVEFKSIEVGDHFFRSVYIAISPTPALSTLHEHIHTKLGIEPHTPSFPHVSLSYIDDEDAQKGDREWFLWYLENAGKVDRENSELVRLNCSSESGAEDWMKGFHAAEIWVANCDGPVEGWSVLDRVPITRDIVS